MMAVLSLLLLPDVVHRGDNTDYNVYQNTDRVNSSLSSFAYSQSRAPYATVHSDALLHTTSTHSNRQSKQEQLNTYNGATDVTTSR